MKILEVRRVISFVVETDEKEFPIFRRSELGGSWENLMGESWESVYSNEDELEAAYQEWLRSSVDQTRKERWRGDSDVAPANPAAWPITVDVAVRPVAWLHDLPDRYHVLHDEARALWLKACPKQVEHYTIPLYRHEQREPLSTEAACALLKDALGIDPLLDGNLLKMLRAVERAHGIT